MKIEFYHIDAFEAPIYEPIWRQLNAQGVDAKLVAVPGEKNTAGATWFDFERFKAYCTQRNLPFTTEADPTANLAITTQNIDILRNYTCPKVRVMYGPILYPKAWGMQKHATAPFDAVLTHSTLYTNYYSNWIPVNRLPVVGYPRYDDYFGGKLNRDQIRQRWGVNNTKPVVVFMPTWDVNTGFDIFLPALLKLTDKYQILLRPHHCTLRFEPKRMAKLVESGLPIIDNAFDLSELYKGADAVIADVRSGGVFESVLCSVPTIGMVIDINEKTGWLALSRVGDIINLCFEPKQLESAIDNALTSTSKSLQCRIWAEKHVAYRDGTAAQHAANALIKIAAANLPKPVNPTIEQPLNGLLISNPPLNNESK